MTDPSSESVYIGSLLPEEPVAAAAGFSFVRCGAICPAMQAEPEAGFAVFGYKEKKMTGVPVIFFFASSIIV